jgi:hypothetical protein
MNFDASENPFSAAALKHRIAVAQCLGALLFVFAEYQLDECDLEGSQNWDLTFDDGLPSENVI